MTGRETTQESRSDKDNKEHEGVSARNAEWTFFSPLDGGVIHKTHVSGFFFDGHVTILYLSSLTGGKAQNLRST